MPPLTKEQKEDLRREVLSAAAVRAPAALTVRQLFAASKRGLDFLFEEADVLAACELLKGLKYLEDSTEELGSTKYWRATSEGVLRVERGL